MRITVADEKCAVQLVLSSLFHHKNSPKRKNDEELEPEDITEAVQEISSLIDREFNYDESLNQIEDIDFMIQSFDECSCNYERLQIARIARDGDNIDRVTKKFLDESLHVDNGYIFNLILGILRLYPKA